MFCYGVCSFCILLDKNRCDLKFPCFIIKHSLNKTWEQADQTQQEGKFELINIKKYRMLINSRPFDNEHVLKAKLGLGNSVLKCIRVVTCNTLSSTQNNQLTFSC